MASTVGEASFTASVCYLDNWWLAPLQFPKGYPWFCRYLARDAEFPGNRRAWNLKNGKMNSALVAQKAPSKFEKKKFLTAESSAPETIHYVHWYIWWNYISQRAAKIVLVCGRSELNVTSHLCHMRIKHTLQIQPTYHICLISCEDQV